MAKTVPLFLPLSTSFSCSPPRSKDKRESWQSVVQEDGFCDINEQLWNFLFSCCSRRLINLRWVHLCTRYKKEMGFWMVSLRPFLNYATVSRKSRCFYFHNSRCIYSFAFHLNIKVKDSSRSYQFIRQLQFEFSVELERPSISLSRRWLYTGTKVLS